MVRANWTAAALAGLASLTVGLSAARAEIIAGTTFQNFLITWDSADPATVLTGVAIQGLGQNENILGLDTRPSNGQIYALGSFGRLYTLDMTTGQATRVGTNPFSPALNGSSFGSDFNPTNDTLRVVSNAKQNLRINPGNASITVDQTIRPLSTDEGANSAANIVHLAYSNNQPGATSTVLYGVDTGRDRLVRFDNPNTGQFTTLGALNFDSNELGGFDISSTSGIAYGAFMNASQSRTTFGTVNLTTGAFTPIDEVGGGALLTAMTTVTIVPAPGAMALLGLGGLAFIRRKR
jgi:hypothetical protein